MEAQNSNNHHQHNLENQDKLHQLPGQDFQEQRKLPGHQYCCTMANFHMGKKIGRGQFSEVYRATYLLESRQVALKKVQIFEMRDVEVRPDYIKEIDLLKVSLTREDFTHALGHGSTVVSPVDLHPWDQGSSLCHGSICVEFLCSPRVIMGFSPGTLDFPSLSKNICS
nr:serine/threonine-protein kinase Nek6-like [Paramormyrops kingsleyae]